MSRYRVFRIADGVRIEGTSRPIFVHNIDTYYLEQLTVFADGLIDGWEPTNLDGLRELLASGRIATSFEAGARASAFQLANWKFADPWPCVTPEQLLGEVADEIDRLNDRPDSRGRCLLAVEAYLADRTRERLEQLRRRYLEVPEHQRIYVLGDMDANDRPLRILLTPVGESTGDPDETEPVTAADHAAAFAYFEERSLREAEYDDRVPADGPEHPTAATVTVPCVVYPRGWPATVGLESFQIEYPARVEFDGHGYPSVEHAYWALSTSDETARAAIAVAERGFDAADLAESAPRRDGWELMRPGVMLRLLRDKYFRHPELARLLSETGDGRIVYHRPFSSYWGSQGTNWLGRLLEIVRSELAVERAGLGHG